MDKSPETGEWDWGLPVSPEPVSVAHADVQLPPIEGASDVLAAIGEVSREKLEKRYKDNLSSNQRVTICQLARHQFVTQGFIDSQSIWDQWPANAEASHDLFFKPGPRPSQNQIQDFTTSDDYREAMSMMGIEVGRSETGLTVEQIGLLTILSNVADGKDFKQKLRIAGVAYSTFQAWMKIPAFKNQYKQFAADSLKDVLPAAKIALSSKAAAGDAVATKLVLEMTDEYNPNNRQVLESKQIVQILLGILEEEVKDISTLQRIGAKIQLRTLGLAGESITGEITNG